MDDPRPPAHGVTVEPVGAERQGDPRQTYRCRRIGHPTALVGTHDRIGGRARFGAVVADRVDRDGCGQRAGRRDDLAGRRAESGEHERTSCHRHQCSRSRLARRDVGERGRLGLVECCHRGEAAGDQTETREPHPHQQPIDLVTPPAHHPHQRGDHTCREHGRGHRHRSSSPTHERARCVAVRHELVHRHRRMVDRSRRRRRRRRHGRRRRYVRRRGRRRGACDGELERSLDRVCVTGLDVPTKPVGAGFERRVERRHERGPVGRIERVRDANGAVRFEQFESVPGFDGRIGELDRDRRQRTLDDGAISRVGCLEIGVGRHRRGPAEGCEHREAHAYERETRPNNARLVRHETDTLTNDRRNCDAVS